MKVFDRPLTDSLRVELHLSRQTEIGVIGEPVRVPRLHVLLGSLQRLVDRGQRRQKRLYLPGNDSRLRHFRVAGQNADTGRHARRQLDGRRRPQIATLVCPSRHVGNKLSLPAAHLDSGAIDFAAEKRDRLLYASLVTVDFPGADPVQGLTYALEGFLAVALARVGLIDRE